MKLPPLLPLLPPALAAAAAAFVCATPLAVGYDTLGFRLGLDQRDFRVQNNFGDPEANDNKTPDPRFPGWLGADVAIWKASVEWGSGLHGDGGGDPHQPGDLGSGAANFDPSFQGRHEGPVGAQNTENVHVELAGCAGGTIAFTGFGPNGWHTFYYSCWIFEDGPEEDWPDGVGKYDLQGIATHEYGHALGLGHSTVADATMHATTRDGKAWRSLHADDVAGVQAVYGVASAAKPLISGVSRAGGVLTIDGMGFDASENQVWFTRAGLGDGQPVKVEHVPASGAGTRITVAVPAEAGSGDVLVRAGLAGVGESLSNAWPLELTCAPAVSYCVTTPNSVGPGALIGVAGSQSVTANALLLGVTGAVPQTFGLFFYSDTPGQTPVGNGVLCLGGAAFRLPAVAVDAAGAATWALDVTAPPKPGGQITAGSTWYFQFWYRDTAAGGAGYDFSDAIEVPFCD